jgi:hypothetical protein
MVCVVARSVSWCNGTCARTEVLLQIVRQHFDLCSVSPCELAMPDRAAEMGACSDSVHDCLCHASLWVGVGPAAR